MTKKPVHYLPILSAVVFGLTLASSIRVTRSIDLPSRRWEPDIRQFEASDETNPPPAHSFLFVGSSSIRFWNGIEGAFPRHKVFRRGFGGSELADATAYADRIVIPYKPRMVLLYAGDNDIANGKSPEQVFSDFTAFVGKVQAALPAEPIGYIAIKPSIARLALVSQIRMANKLIQDYANAGNHVVYIDVFTPMLNRDGAPRPELFVPDGLHLNDKGYALWASLIRPVLDRVDPP